MKKRIREWWRLVKGIVRFWLMVQLGAVEPTTTRDPKSGIWFKPSNYSGFGQIDGEYIVINVFETGTTDSFDVYLGRYKLMTCKLYAAVNHMSMNIIKVCLKGLVVQIREAKILADTIDEHMKVMRKEVNGSDHSSDAQAA